LLEPQIKFQIIFLIVCSDMQFKLILTLSHVPCPCAEPGAVHPEDAGDLLEADVGHLAVETAEEGVAGTVVEEPLAGTVAEEGAAGTAVAGPLAGTVAEVGAAGTVVVEPLVGTAAAGLLVVELPAGIVAVVLLVGTVAEEHLAEIVVGFVEAEVDPEVAHLADTDSG
jgi:hypothetical protein